MGYDLHDLAIYKFMPKVQYNQRVAEAAAEGVQLPPHPQHPKQKQKQKSPQEKHVDEKSELGEAALSRGGGVPQAES